VCGFKRVVEYAVAGVACTNVSPKIVNCWIHDCSQQGVWLTGSSALIQGNAIEYNSSEGIYCTDASSPQIFNNNIQANTLYGIRTLGTAVVGHNSQPVIRGNTLEGTERMRCTRTPITSRARRWFDAGSNCGARRRDGDPSKIYDYADAPTTAPVVNFGNWLGSSAGRQRRAVCRGADCRQRGMAGERLANWGGWADSGERATRR